jgi:hypothetical protein
MNKAEIAEELGLVEASKQLDGTTHIDVNEVFVDDEKGIEFSLDSREMFVLRKISRVLDEYDLEVDSVVGDGPELVRVVSRSSVDVTPI